MNIGQRVRAAREDLGMQRTVLAHRVGVAENTIYRIETGRRTPSVELLEKIARELRTEPADLLKEPARPKSDAPHQAGRVVYVRPIADSLEVSDQQLVAEGRLERVRELMAAWGAGELSSVVVDEEIKQVYATSA